MTDDRHIVMTATDLTIGYRAGKSLSEVARGLNLTLAEGTVTALLGPNGIGKSTLLRTLSRQQPALEGEVRVFGSDLSEMTAVEVARLISVVHTERTNAGALTVGELVGLGRQPYTGFFGRLSATDRRIVSESMEAVGVESLASRFMATISDGERQKVMIARALAQQTPVMILDEPTSFLDVASRLETIGLLTTLARDHGKAILLSTHDISDAMTVADALWLMLPDHTVAAGPKAEILATPLMDSLFAGRSIYFDPSTLSYRFNSRK